MISSVLKASMIEKRSPGLRSNTRLQPIVRKGRPTHKRRMKYFLTRFAAAIFCTCIGARDLVSTLARILLSIYALMLQCDLTKVTTNLVYVIYVSSAIVTLSYTCSQCLSNHVRLSIPWALVLMQFVEGYDTNVLIVSLAAHCVYSITINTNYYSTMYVQEYDDYWWETHNSILHVAMSQIILGEPEQAPHWSWQRPMSQEMFVSMYGSWEHAYCHNYLSLWSISITSAHTI